MFDTLLQDLRYGARSLRRTPTFTAAAIVTLALGIGANAALFRLFDVVMLRTLPVDAPGELFAVRETDSQYNGAEPTGRRLRRFSYPRFLDLQAAMPAGGTLAAMSRVTRQLTVRTPGSAAAGVGDGQFVSGRFFDTFRVTAARGRLLNDDDNRAEAEPVAVVSYAWWQRQFGGASDVVGQSLVVNGSPATIVGVTQRGFTGAFADEPAHLWFPLVMQHALRYRGNASNYGADPGGPWMPEDRIAWLTVVGRATGALLPLQRRLAVANRLGLQRYADDMEADDERRALLAHGLALDPAARGFSTVRDQYADAMFLLAAMVGLVLLVACVNVANLLLARAAARQGEIGLRVSLGATRARLLRQCLTESALLAAAGGAAGLALGHGATRLLGMAVPETVGETLRASAWLDARLLGFVGMASLATVLVSGLLPALRASRLDARAHVGMRATSAVAGMRPLVALQLGLCFVVVVSAALFGRSLVNLARFDPGFDRDHLVSIGIEPVISGYPAAEMPALHQRIIAALEQVPGVRKASVSLLALASGGQAITDYRLEGYTPAPGEAMEFHANRVGPRYFETVGMPVIDGRDFVEGDGSRSRQVAIITEGLARRYFRGRSPIGRHVAEDDTEIEIVGVVRDAWVQNLRTAPVPMIYFPLDQTRSAARAVDVRVAGNPTVVLPALEAALRRAEPRLHIDRVVTLDDQLALNAARERQLAYFTSAFGVLALLLACVGVYGVLSYSVTRRTREVGVRMAVGASPADVLLLVLRDGGRIGLAGLAGGVAAALAVHQFISGLLFDVNPTDPGTYGAVAGVLGLMTFAACYVPARRAARVEPSAALRSE
jgi:predicted permease